MMARFCAYAQKVFGLGSFLPSLTDTRLRPCIPTAAVFASLLVLFATRRGSFNGLEPDLRIPRRLRGIVGDRIPSVDSLGRISAGMDPTPLQQFLADIAHQLKRNKALTSHEGWYAAAVDGHEFFSSRKRCCARCQRRTITVDGQEVTEYFHQGVVCHLIGQDLALVLDVELLQPGEGELTAARRLLDRVLTNFPRFFDVICGDELYFNAPFINFCLDRHKHVIVTAKGEHRLLVQDAAGLFPTQPQGCFVAQKGQRTVQFWDEEGFTSCEGAQAPLRFLRTEETVHRRERIAGQWHETEQTTTWSWATTLTKTQMSERGVWRCGHARWDIENDCFNTLASHWGLNHCFKHDPQAIVTILLTGFIVYALLQSFFLRNLKPALRARLQLTLIALARELDRDLVGCRAPWSGELTRAP
jgi:hypothetical protein